MTPPNQPSSPSPPPGAPPPPTTTTPAPTDRILAVTTAAAASFTQSHDEETAEDARLERLDVAVGVALRALNGCAHVAACAILVAIMAEFLARTRGAWVAGMSPQAATLVALLGIDIGLDVLSVARPRGVWPAWSVLLRMACGIGYLAIFMAYIGMGRVFPDGYTYWGLSKGFCGPVVYLFLWLVGVWNLLHTALHRHELGNGLRTSLFPHRILPRPDTASNHRASWVRWGSSRLGLRWRRRGRANAVAGDLEDGAAHVQRDGRVNSISLVQMHGHKKTVSLATSSAGSGTEITEIEERDTSPARTAELRL